MNRIAPRVLSDMSPFARMNYVLFLMRTVDDDGNPIDPLLTAEQGRALLDLPGSAVSGVP